MSGPALSTGSRQLEVAIALQQSAFAAVLRAGAYCPGAGAYCASPGGASRMFRGTTVQIRAVRSFVREVLIDHPAADNAVLAASELASNAVSHSASGLDGGMFMVHIAEVSATHATVVVTDQGSDGDLQIRAASPDAESGRGLTVVRELSSTFIIAENELGMRSVLAVIPAESPPGGDLALAAPAASCVPPAQPSTSASAHHGPNVTAEGD